MEPRVCPDCGVAEARWTTSNVAYVNLSPLTGQCVDCLIKLAKGTPWIEPEPEPQESRRWW